MNERFLRYSNDYRQKYWRRIFNSLKNTVEDVIVAFENEQSAEDCQEIIDMIQFISEDFRNLIKKLHIIKASKNKKSYNNEEYMSDTSSLLLLSDIYDPSKPEDNPNSMEQSFCVSENDDILSLEPSNRRSNFKNDDMTSEIPSIFSSCRHPSSNSENAYIAINHHDGLDENSCEGTPCDKKTFNFDLDVYQDEINSDDMFSSEQREKNLSTPIPFEKLDSSYKNNKMCLYHYLSNSDKCPNYSQFFSNGKIQSEDDSSHKYSANSMQRIKEKQRKAEELREKFLSVKKDKSRQINKKSDCVFLKKKRLSMIKSTNEEIQERLNAAESKRQAELCKKISKARDEDIKGREIAFIQSMEAEQKQHLISVKHEESRTRLLELEDERRKRLERRAEQEEAAKLRRTELEATKRARFEKYFAKWKLISEKKANITLLAKQAAQNRVSDRLRKVEHLEKIQKSQIEELKEKIKRKQEDSEKRHQNVLLNISRKALVMSTPKEDSIYSDLQVLSNENTKVNSPSNSQTLQRLKSTQATPVDCSNIKWCKACHVVLDINRGVDCHINGPRHHASVRSASIKNKDTNMNLDEFNSDKLVDAMPNQRSPKCTAYHQRLPLMKEHLANLLNKMKQNRQSFLSSLESGFSDSRKSDLTKLIKDAIRHVQESSETFSPWPESRLNAFEKALSSILRKLSTQMKSCETLCQSTLNAFLTALVSHIVHGVGIDERGRLCRNQLVPRKNLLTSLSVIQKLLEEDGGLLAYLVKADLFKSLMMSLHVQFILPTLAMVQDVAANRPIPNQTNHCCHHHFQQSHQHAKVEHIENELTIELTKVVTMLLKKIQNCALLLSEASFTISVQNIVQYAIKSEFIDTMTTYFDYVSNQVDLTSLAVKDASSATTETVNSLTQLLSVFLSLSLKILSVKEEKKKKKNTKKQTKKKPDETDDKESGESSSSHYLITTILKDDPNNLMRLILGYSQETELFGIIGMLYSIIFHRSIRQKLYSSRIPQSECLMYNNSHRWIDEIIFNSLTILNILFRFNQSFIQNFMAEEVLSLQMRHILNHLTFYGSIESVNSSRELFQFPQPSRINEKRFQSTTSLESISSSSTVPTGALQVRQTFAHHPADGNSLKMRIQSDMEILNQIEHVLLDEKRLNKLFTMQINPGPMKCADFIIIRSCILMRALELTSHLTSLNEPLQISLGQIGHPPTLLQRIARLPTLYFEKNLTMSIIYSSLICFCYENPSNTFVLSSELSPKLLANFIESSTLQIQLGSDNLSIDFLREKFPHNLWQSAVDYFRNYDVQSQK